MPITGPQALTPITQAEFAELDYQVMRLAFGSQNQLGRLCEEEIYQNDLMARFAAAGLTSTKEVPIVVEHGSFKKTYLIDLIVAHTGIYELKTAFALSGAHETQLLNYLFLSGAHHGKLINFRPAQVESRFINTTLTPLERRQFSVDSTGWKERDRTDEIFRETLLALLKDWGCRLELSLYNEAMIHFAGGEDQVVQRIPLTCDDTRIGTQCFNLINPETAFRLTALTEGISNYEHQLRAMLRLSPLRTLQWVNLDRQRIQLVTLTR
jgi:GxxExxY protein